MDILVLNPDLESVDIIDTFESAIWTERYFKYGDFEIHTPVDNVSLALLQKDNYLWIKESEHVMIIEDLQIETDPEKGNYLTVTGRSLESILDRRIVWQQTILDGDFQNGIQRLLNENIIAPTDLSRKIDNFIFEPSTDPEITGLTIRAQFTGDNLYEVIQKLCESANIGFKIILTDDNQFKFKLYSGVDRSYDQLENPYIVFSPKNENITNSNYIESKKALKTVTLVAGEGEGANRTMVEVSAPSGSETGINRREHFTDARDVSSTVDGGNLTPEEYAAQLTQRGSEKLAENIFVSSFEGKIDTTQMYKYGEDFFMGDILQIVNEYGMESKVRMVELVQSQGPNGIDIHPTFSAV